ncbi:DUF421 domain-containing protein [Reyranella sp.]|uniref:DUF421 domain-containing protein n=1 Tax=Reyranella sp. TaxID=1929291 RepID=UPI003BA9E6F7
MFFDSWSGLLRVLVAGTLAYGALIVFLRVSGKRTLTKLNAFDLVVTVALGSTLSSLILTKSVALSEGLLALALLIALQYGITWLSVRSQSFRDLVKSEPTLLVHRGQLVPGALRRQRVTVEEVWAAVRAEGVADLSDLAAVVLETDGSISVVRQGPPGDGTLADVARPGPGRSASDGASRQS